MRGARPRSPRRDLHRPSRPPRGSPPGTPPSARGRRLSQPLPDAGRRACPTRPAASASLNASRWCSPAGSRNGSDVPISRWSTSPRMLLVEPGHLVAVEHRALVGLEHPRGARVDDDQPGLVAEVAGVAPAVGRRAPGRPARRRSSSASVRSSSSVALVRRDPLPDLVLGALARATGCRGAGRPSTTPARRRSGRATTSSPPSRCAPRPARCSSRRGCRGRRRSSRSAASRAASGSRGRSRPGGRGGRTPRSP